MEITENARKVLEARYLIKNEEGLPVETVEELFSRVAQSIAAVDALHDPKASVSATTQIFYDMMTNLEFLPNSPTLMNAGRPLGQLSACFVLPVDDSMEGIFEAIKQAALIHKSGGGTGFSFSRLRPKGSTVNSTGGVASGPVSFMRVFNMATEAVKQGGTRRGANMGILRVDHPDILEFINCKQNGQDITNFNISIGVTEAFMQAVLADDLYDLHDPHTHTVTASLRAAEVFSRMVEASWRNGDPGLIFLDRLNRDNVVPGQGEIESTNPCGEQPLLPFESCNLGSINLVKMLRPVTDTPVADTPAADTYEMDTYEVDWDKLEKTVRHAVHFLDNVIDANKYPFRLIEEATKKTRKIGLGIMGFADMLLLLRIPYCSDEAALLAEKIMAFINTKGKEASVSLAKDRGAFPLFAESTLAQAGVLPRRNATVTTIAPTGTLSIISGVSSGVEPVFAYVFTRHVLDGACLFEVNPILRAELEKRNLYSEDLMQRLSSGEPVSAMDDLPAGLRQVFVSAHDISPEWHIRMQAAFQKHTDNAVSKTVNFPNSATIEDVKEVYMLAFQLGCKGVTIYRDGSRDGQVLTSATAAADAAASAMTSGSEAAVSGQSDQSGQIALIGQITPRPRPEVTSGITERMRIGCGNLYVTVNYDDRGICEVFTNTGKAGGCPSQSEATARLVSIALRSGLDARRLVEELKGIRCPSTIRQQGMKAMSCPDAIARIIEKVLNRREEGAIPLRAPLPTSEVVSRRQARFCPDCGSRVEHEGGCVVCRSCGYSKCG